MKSIKILAPAKINLFLEVNERLENGYHNLSSIMQSVDLYDIVTVTVNDSGVYTIDCPDYIGNKEDNLAIKAARAFFENNTKLQFSGLHIVIEKNIPMCAGMAGGSADAAAVLRGLNSIYEEPCTLHELSVMGKRLGADVPYCLINRTSLAQGIGEVLTPITPLADCFIVVAIGNEQVHTKWAFEELDKQTHRDIQNISSALSAMKSGNIKEIGKSLYNAFETVSPHSKEIKDIMESYSACGVLMSGSGPSVFALYDSESNADCAYTALKKADFKAYLCHPYNADIK